MTETQEIEAKIEELGGWRGAMLGRVRALIMQTDGEIVEELKWRKPSNPSGVRARPLGSSLCAGEHHFPNHSAASPGREFCRDWPHRRRGRTYWVGGKVTF